MYNRKEHVKVGFNGLVGSLDGFYDMMSLIRYIMLSDYFLCRVLPKEHYQKCGIPMQVWQ
jgi:hypothetical protein